MAVKKDPLALARRWKAGATNTLDLTKSAQWDFINDQYARAGLTKKSAPKELAALAAARKPARKTKSAKTKLEDNAELVPLNMIVSLGFSADGGTYATAVSAIPGGTVISTLILELIDPANGNVLATNTVSQFGVGEYLPISVTGPRATGPEVEAIFTVNYQTTGKPTIITTRLTVSDRADGAPDVREPKHTSEGPDFKIAVGAHRPLPGYDYWYYPIGIFVPNLRLPLVGTQKYQSPVVKPFEPEISLYLIAPTRGGAAPALAKTLSALRASLKVTGNKVTWNLPWSGDLFKDRSAKFGSAAWGEEQVLLIFTIDVRTKKAAAPVRTAIVSTLTPDASEKAGFKTLPAIHYTWN